MHLSKCNERFVMESWRKVLLGPDETLKTAIEVLNKEKPRIVLVVDGSERLLGTLTDGDIRRSLLRNCTMETSIDEIMNRNPRVAAPEENKSVITERMIKYSLLQMPIIDDDKVIQGLEIIRHTDKNKIHNNPVLIMAGGFGKRLRPFTEDIPKPLLKVGTKPILETILKQFIECGFHLFYISTHYKAEMIREYFGNGDKWGVTIHYIHEETPLGTAGALGLLPKDFPDLPMLVMNSDVLTAVNYQHLLMFHQEQSGVASVCVREYEFQIPYGVIEKEGYKIKSITEKPTHKFFVNAGIYVLDSHLVKKIDSKAYLDMPTLLEQYIKSGDQVNMFPVHEYWLDIGRVKEYEQAQTEIHRLTK
ncbi:nucleotidyltransferase family protein [Amylibacter sp.]|nr:nucleotidyltransferase family protein [Amylibacter sp.]